MIKRFSSASPPHLPRIVIKRTYFSKRLSSTVNKPPVKNENLVVSSSSSTISAGSSTEMNFSAYGPHSNIVYEPDFSSFYKKTRHAMIGIPILMAGTISLNEIVDKIPISVEIYPILGLLSIVGPAVAWQISKYHVASLEILSNTHHKIHANSFNPSHLFPIELKLKFRIKPVFGKERTFICKVSDLKFKPKWFNRVWEGRDIDGNQVFMHMESYLMRNDPNVLGPLWDQVIAQTSVEDIKRMGFLSRTLYMPDVQSVHTSSKGLPPSISSKVGKNSKSIKSKEKAKKEDPKDKLFRAIVFVGALGGLGINMYYHRQYLNSLEDSQ